MLFAIVSGLAMPCMALLSAQAVSVYNPESTDDERHQGVLNLIYVAVSVSITLWIASYFQFAFL